MTASRFTTQTKIQNNVNIKRIRKELVESNNIGMAWYEFEIKFALLKNISMRPRFEFVEAFNSIASLIGGWSNVDTEEGGTSTLPLFQVPLILQSQTSVSYWIPFAIQYFSLVIPLRIWYARELLEFVRIGIMLLLRYTWKDDQALGDTANGNPTEAITNIHSSRYMY